MPHVEIERRACIRFQIPGATLSFRIKKLFSPKGYGEEFCPIADISRGGLRFLSKSILKINQGITMKLAIPGEQLPLELKGQIKWIGKHAGSNFKCQVGVQLNPYGDETKDQNYPGVLVKIIAMEQKFTPPEERTEE